MERAITLVIIAGWLTLFGSLSSTDNRISYFPTPGSPVIHFEETIFDFGQIRHGDKAVHIFTFTNQGKKPLVLVRVKSSCGCTTPSWSKVPVKKNKEGSITVKYNSDITGKFRKKITVISNAENSPVTLIIVGEVIQNKQKINNINNN